MSEEDVKTLVFTPTWNESENIERLIREAFRLNPTIDFLVVDDNSPDGTAEIVRRLEKEFPRLHLLLRQGVRGRGWAGIAGFIWALDHDASYIIEMDADFSHQPRYISSFIENLLNADMVIGSRYITGGHDLRPGLLRRLISLIANYYQKLMFNTHVKDCTSGYRAYRAEVLNQIGVRDLRTWGPAILSDVLFRVIKKKFKIIEIPIDFPDREQGLSTFNIKIMIEGLINVARLRIRGVK